MYAEDMDMSIYGTKKEYEYYDRLHKEKYRDRNQSKAHHQSTLSRIAVINHSVLSSSGV